MDEDLRNYLDEMKRDLGAKMHGVEERTAAPIAGEAGTLHTELKAMEDRMHGHVDEAIFSSETKLLGEFWKWARTADARYRQHHGNVAGLDERVMAVEERVAELERRRDAA
jgi:hypothetical protein